MSLRSRLDPIDRDIDAILAEDLSPQARSSALADVARGELRAAQDVNARAMGGRTPPHDTFVDGRRGAIEDSVSPQGVIAYEFTLLEELFAWIADQLVTHAPVLTGKFSRSFAFFADGVEVSEGAPAPQASEYVFLNLQPYARKIERGLSSQAPDGVFEVLAAMAAARFGNVARIRFGFRSVPAGAVGEWAARTNLQSRASSRNRPGAQRTDWLTRQPAIVITTGR
ncbi:hypothetical protein [Chenggangzhangella methanolivorans]|uniref:Uncharacterized protein n=1 Tax=Chenggangzhangella methanolivorans TaxID=1437009 RepID=A0A9E6REP3_9HYPH|nr:hypothetical protein [Chenggangzhangella methanolivorans]QZN99541.1 hypothetical protein K6K41_22995 [Chenggangzhangella methanolivorans]